MHSLGPDLGLALEATPPSLLTSALLGVSGDPQDPRVMALCRWVAAELGTAGDVDAGSTAPTPEQLAAAIGLGPARRAVVQRLVLAAMLVPPLDAPRLDRLEAYAGALGCGDEPALVDLRRALAGQHRRLTSGLMRRFPPMDRVRAHWREGSLGQRWRLVKALARLPDRRTAARYQALGSLDQGTLGRVFFDHCRANSFPLPGERRGLPEPMTFHDMGHGLVGAGTDIAGETRMAGFEAGCMGDRGFTMLEFTLLLFNLGAKLPTDAAPTVGAVDVELLLRAYAEGQRATLDILSWDPWPEVGESLAVLRQRYSIG